MMKVMTRNSTAQTHNHKRPMALEMISTLPHKSHKEAKVRKLTEKGQELHDEQRRKVAHRFSVSYEKWKAVIKDAKGALSGQCSNNLLNEHITKVSNASKNLNAVYEELRHIDILDHDTRRRVDTCEAVTKKIIKTARGYLNTGKSECQVDEEQGVKDTESVFKSAASDKMSIKSHRTKSSQSSARSQGNSKITSRHSSQSSAHRLEAAAEVAANEATLQALLEQEQDIIELERLEAEDAESKRVLKAKRRQIVRLETIGKIKAAKARQQVYKQSECSDDEIDKLLYQNVSLKEKKEVNQERNLSKHHPPPQVMTLPKQEDSTAALVRVFAESISASRLPIPEPSMFNDDPLRFNDWKVSFQTLID
ncbi:uncharacterized protein LOC129701947 [Leucoraja erinacea]|uniref:uncharacterized protein LOC129701947 n=1 Tax=Leucoraja erinaceus TaxID=7782 RepID=UPI002458E028|nr:uncharacterized protein LOC129701947 [Leucoraja erinacea]